MKYKYGVNEIYLTCNTTTYKKCKHSRGWYQNIPWWGIFKKYVFICEDCNKILDEKRDKVIR